MPKSMKFEKTIDVPASSVYYALTNQAAVTQWLCSNAQADAREDGAIFLNWSRPAYYAAGQFTKLKPNKTVAFTWQGRGEPAQTRVRIKLSEDNDTTLLKLTHKGLGKGEKWAEARKQTESGWTFSLENLKQVLETGLDKRLYDRPFLGVLIAGTISDEEAQQLGVEGGIRISGTMDDTGAAAAGLQAQDVIIRLGDNDIKDFAALGQAIQSHKVHDSVELEYVREGEKQTTEMTLLPRPHPQIPEMPTDLSRAVQKAYEIINVELDAVVSGLDETAAAYKESEDAWSAKEITAHLLTNERALQIWIASMVDNQYLQGWPNNPQPWVRSAANTYSMEKLVELFKEAEAETVELLSLLPEDTVSRKSTYYTIAENTLNWYPSHSSAHLLEMKEAIQKARAAVS